MGDMTSRVYNTTDGPLIIDDEGHILAGRESGKVADLDAEPVHGHLDAGRLIDLTDAKEDGAEAEAIAEAARVEAEEAAAKAAAPKPTPPVKRS